MTLLADCITLISGGATIAACGYIVARLHAAGYLHADGGAAVSSYRHTRMKKSTGEEYTVQHKPMVRSTPKPKVQKEKKPLITPEELEAIQQREKADRELTAYRADVASALTGLGYRKLDYASYLTLIVRPGDLSADIRGYLQSMQPRSSITKDSTDKPTPEKTTVEVTKKPPVDKSTSSEDEPTISKPVDPFDPEKIRVLISKNNGEKIEFDENSRISNLQIAKVVDSLREYQPNEDYFTNGDRVEDYILETLRDNPQWSKTHKLPRYPEERAIEAIRLCCLVIIKLNGGKSAFMRDIYISLVNSLGEYGLHIPNSWEVSRVDAPDDIDQLQAELRKAKDKLAIYEGKDPDLAIDPLDDDMPF